MIVALAMRDRYEGACSEAMQPHLVKMHPLTLHHECQLRLRGSCACSRVCVVSRWRRQQFMLGCTARGEEFAARVAQDTP